MEKKIMGYADLLTMRCAIQVQPASDDDSGAYATVAGLESVPCRLTSGSGMEIVTDMTMTVTRLVLHLLPGVAITGRNRVVIDGNTFDVMVPRPIQGATGVHHLEVDVKFNS